MSIITLYPSKDVSIAANSVGWQNNQTGAKNGLELGCWDWPKERPYAGWYAYAGRVLQKYDLPLMPRDAYIKRATLKLHLWNKEWMHDYNKAYYAYQQTPQLDIHRVTQDWDEGMGNGITTNTYYTGANWNYRFRTSAPSYPWTKAGGDFDAVPVATLTKDKNSFLWEFDVTTLVKGWYTNSYPNHGIMIKYANDTVRPFAGTMTLVSKENPDKTYMPYIEIEYGTPPDKPRGTSPNYYSLVSPQIPDSMKLRWKFVDTTEQRMAIGKQTPIIGKADVVILLNTHSQMYNYTYYAYDKISKYLDRLSQSGVDYQVGLITFADTIQTKYPLLNNKEEFLRNMQAHRSNTGWTDNREAGLEAIMDTAKGALSYTFREDAKKHFIVIGNAPFHTSNTDKKSVHTVASVRAEMDAQDITLTVITYTSSTAYTELLPLATGEGGRLIDIDAQYFNTIEVAYKSLPQAPLNENDYQKRATVSLRKVNLDGSRTAVATFEIPDATNEVDLSNTDMEDNAIYEWQVTAYDGWDLVSPPSNVATFRYRVLPAYSGIPIWQDLPSTSRTVTLSYLNEIKQVLRDEAEKYIDYDANKVDSLFTSSVVASKKEFSQLTTILNDLRKKEALTPLAEDMVGVTFSIDDIEKMRLAIEQIAATGPATQAQGVAAVTKGDLTAPPAITVDNTAVKSELNVSWSNSTRGVHGLSLTLQDSPSTDIYFYKMYVTETLPVADGEVPISSVYYLTPDQVGEDATVSISHNGDAAIEIYSIAVDKNGRASEPAAVQTPELSTLQMPALPQFKFHIYTVEFQVRYWDATEPNPASLWFPLYQGTETSFKQLSRSEGSYWYRVKAIDTYGKSTDWVYTTEPAVIKY